MKTAYQIIRRPVITEKGLGIKENQNTLVFQVSPNATKTEIKEAVQAIFKVKVNSVRTANYPGKERRRGKFAGYRPDWKKAYVRLRAGEKMPELARRHGVTETTLYRWKSKYGDMEVSEAKRLRELESENAQLKRLLADAMLDKAALKELLSKKW